MNDFFPLIPLFVPSFSSKGNIFITSEENGYVSDNFDLLKVLGVRVSNSYLISAYDVFYGYMPKNPNEWPETNYLFIDSGGYETNDSFDLIEKNKFNYKKLPWDKDKMIETYHSICSCDKFENSTIILSGYDIFDSFEKQLDSIQELSMEFPKQMSNFIIKFNFSFEELLLKLNQNAKKINCLGIIGITEKELGETIKERLLNIISLKKALDSFGWSGKIHVFGGLNPDISKLYYLAGADIFDGLSWQRMHYRTNSTFYDIHSFDISLNDYENKFFMMKDNLTYLQEISLDMSFNSSNRIEKSILLENLLKEDGLTIHNVIDVLEV